LGNYFSILGLDKSASDRAIQAAFDYLNSKIKALSFPENSLFHTEQNKALKKVSEAYKTLANPKDRASHISEITKQNPRQASDFKPLIGHLCVAAGIITYKDLEDAVKSQTSIDLPLGQLLQENRLLSQTQLDGLLMGQKLYGQPNKQLDPIILRLLELDLINEDMVKIALIDQRRSPASLADLLVRREWLSKDILSILEQQPT
jgi:curved DNA-binding protein CbpA